MRLPVAALMAVAACTSASGVGDDDDDVAVDARPAIDAAPAIDAPGLPQFQRCVGRAFTAPPAGDFDHTWNSVIAATNAPIHAGLDTIEVPGAPHARARFMYGTFNDDLEDEPIAVAIDDCTGWQSLGTVRSDDEGAVDVAVTLPLGPGVYEVRYTVVGDASGTTGFLWILPPGTHIVVSDIDGTLTTSDTELFLQIFNGSYLPQAYPSAAALTNAHDAIDHVVVYATGPPTYLTNKTREWLTALGFALGPLKLAPSTGAALPTEGGVGTYKRDFIAGLIAQGLVVDLAYGNASTDIFAYTGAGVPSTQQWIIGSNAGDGGTNPVMDSWAARVSEVQALPPVPQPFRF